MQDEKQGVNELETSSNGSNAFDLAVSAVNLLVCWPQNLPKEILRIFYLTSRKGREMKERGEYSRGKY